MPFDAPIKWRSKILLFGIETTYGVDPTLTGAADAILATNVTLTPMDGNDVSRNLEVPWLGAQGTLPSELHATLAFNVEMAPSGVAGTAPAWGPLLRACAVAETIAAGASVTYNPISDNHESATFNLWIGNTLYTATGVRGTCDFMVNAQGIPVIEFKFTGLWVKPAEAVRPTPDLSRFKKPLLATSAHTPTFTINSVPFVMRSFKLTLANQVVPSFLIGEEEVLITDRADLIETTVRATTITTFDPYDLAENETQVDVTLVHGTVAGAIATFNAPTAQMQRPQALGNTNNITEWPLRLMPIPAAGNDQWTLELT